MARILVTGNAGFLGSHVADALFDRGEEVFGIDDLSGGFERNVKTSYVFFRKDLRKKEETGLLVKGISPDILVHLAADATEGRSQFTPINCTERNYLAYLNTLVPCIKNGLRKVVLVSSMSVYGNQKPPFTEDMERKPEDIYAISKAAMERATEILSEVHNFKYVIIRPHNVYGPRQNLSDPYRNVVGIFINSLLNNKNFYIYGDGEQKRAFTYVDDCVPYIVKAIFQKSCEGEIINIGPTKTYTINELASEVLKAFSYQLLPKYLPARPMEVKEAWCSVAKAEKLLGYKAKVSLKEGIKKTVKWATEIGYQKPKYLNELELVSSKTPKTWKEHLI